MKKNTLVNALVLSIILGVLLTPLQDSFTAHAATLVQPVAQVATPSCNCEGLNDTEVGATTLTIKQNTCRTKKLIDILDKGAKVGDIAGWLGEIGFGDWKYPISTLANLMKNYANDIRHANQTGTGIQFKFAVKFFPPRISLNIGSQVPSRDVFGFVESPKPNVITTRPVQVSGWVRVKGSCVKSIEIIVDSGVRGTAVYGLNRPDAGGPVGWAFEWPANSIGTRMLQVRVTTTGGYNTLLPAVGTSYTTIPVNLTDIAGFVDSPKVNSVLPAPVEVVGWAKIDGMSISRVEVWVDKGLRGYATLNLSRPDAGGNYGWRFLWPARTSGSHTIQVKAIASNGYEKLLPSAFVQTTSIPVVIR